MGNSWYRRITLKHWKAVKLGETVDGIDFKGAWQLARDGSHAYAWPAPDSGGASRFLDTGKAWVRTG